MRVVSFAAVADEPAWLRASGFISDSVLLFARAADIFVSASRPRVGHGGGRRLRAN